MNSRFFLKLAFTNLNRNARLYIPYIIAVSGMVAMLYIVQFMYTNKGLAGNSGAAHIKEMLFFGFIVTTIFAVIFLFYTNSFVIKRRNREFGLYSILGLEKKHIGRVMFMETAMLFAVCLAAGLVVGILFSKAMFLLLLRILGLQSALGFEISPGVIGMTAILMAVIFLATYITNLFRIRVAQPVELLNAGKVGEREPKARWFVTGLGIFCLVSGIVIALSQVNPLAAFGMVFVAILLLIAGTYLLFTAGSVALFKLLRLKQGYYYQTRHFISVSGMIYRMKQNAAGLASICVLSTAVLIILSTTVSLYAGMEDVLRTRFPRNISVEIRDVSNEQATALDSMIWWTAQNAGAPVENPVLERYRLFLATRDANGAFVGSGTDYGQSSNIVWRDFIALFCIPVSEYNRLQGENETLGKNEVLIYSDRGSYDGDTIKIGGIVYNIKGKLETLDTVQNAASRSMEHYWLVVPDDAVDQIAADLRDRSDSSELIYSYSFDVSVPAAEQIALADTLGEKLGQAGYTASIDSMEASRGDMLATYGGLLFLGIFLGGLFLAATILIIYYKQISEGYNDRERFAIMQKVGLTKAEVRAAIRSQVLSVFYLPLIMSGIHMLALFRIITQLLEVLNLTNVGLFALCTGIIFLAFAGIYTAIYAVTARVYYRIVGERPIGEIRRFG